MISLALGPGREVTRLGNRDVPTVGVNIVKDLKKILVWKKRNYTRSDGA
jgi:hypothetical protein